MKIIPYREEIDHSIGKNDDGSWCWSIIQPDCGERLDILDDPGLRGQALTDWLYTRTYNDIFKNNDSDLIYNSREWTHIAFVDDRAVEMIEAPTYRSGRDSLDYERYNFQLAFLVHHAIDRMKL